MLNHINKAKMTGEEIRPADVAASFQQAVVDVLVEKSMRACEELGVKKLALAGGVSANTRLRAEMEKNCRERDIAFCVPAPILCTDNGAMIGAAGYYEYIKGNVADMSLNAYPSLKLGER